eukprot:927260-Pelagomonas_calceolata.AAC.1
MHKNIGPSQPICPPGSEHAPPAPRAACLLLQSLFSSPSIGQGEAGAGGCTAGAGLHERADSRVRSRAGVGFEPLPLFLLRSRRSKGYVANIGMVPSSANGLHTNT